MQMTAGKKTPHIQTTKNNPRWSCAGWNKRCFGFRGPQHTPVLRVMGPWDGVTAKKNLM